jgi:thiol-disulfide isomerase/thioredoxin
MSLTSIWMRVAAAGLAAASLFGSRGDTADLAVGSKAPPIDIEHWIQNREGAFKPVTEFAPDKVYVIEFWATWCGPCVAMMPDLATLQDAYIDKGVTIISVSDEEPETIKDFLDQRVGELLAENASDADTFREVTKSYCLATDPDGSVKKDYYDAAGQNGIPVAFIVGTTGEIEWIGHPSELEEPLGAIVAGTWDRAADRASVKEAKVYQKRLEPIGQLLQEGDPMRAVALVDEMVAGCNNERIRKQLVQLRGAVAAMAAESKARVTLKKTLQRGGPEAIEAFVRCVAAAGNSAKQLNEAAWTVVEVVDQKEDVSGELLAAARAAAEKAARLSPEKFVILETLAHLQAAQGDIEKAIATQKKALEHAGVGPAAAQIRGYLESLEASSSAMRR